MKETVLNNFAIFTGKTSVLEFLFNKAVGFQACNFIKKEAATQVLSCEYCKIYKKTSTLRNVFKWLLLEISKYLTTPQSES